MLNDRLLVHIPEKDGERRSSGGILIPATAQISKRLVWAEVVALGQNVRIGRGRRPGAVQPRRSLRGRGRRQRLHHAARARPPRRRRQPHRSQHRPVPLGRVLDIARVAPSVPRRSMSPMPTGVKIEATPEQLASVQVRRRRPGAGDRPGRRHQGGADDGVDERRDAADDARRGPDGLLEPQPAGGVAQGRHQRRRASTCARRTTTATPTCCCSWSSRRATGACHTGDVLVLLPALRTEADATSLTHAAEPRRVPRAGRPSTRWCRCGPSCSPTSRRRSPRTPSSSATAPGFLLESVEHGERWSRFSFVGRDPVATLSCATA